MREYYENYMCTTPHNPNNIDLSRDVLFQLTNPEKCAIDIKRIDREGFSQGLYFYRLSTYRQQSKALPIKDFSGFTFPRHKGKYISRKFIGTIVTDKGIIKQGQLV